MLKIFFRFLTMLQFIYWFLEVTLHFVFMVLEVLKDGLCLVLFGQWQFWELLFTQQKVIKWDSLVPLHILLWAGLLCFFFLCYGNLFLEQVSLFCFLAVLLTPWAALFICLKKLNGLIIYSICSAFLEAFCFSLLCSLCFCKMQY